MKISTIFELSTYNLSRVKKNMHSVLKSFKCVKKNLPFLGEISNWSFLDKNEAGGVSEICWMSNSSPSIQLLK